MNRTVGDDMSPLVEHDQLSKEMKEGMISFRTLNLWENIWLFFFFFVCFFTVSHPENVLLFPHRFNL